MTRSSARDAYVCGKSGIGRLPGDGLGALDVPDDGVAARREDALVVVLPAHAVVLVLAGSEDFEDLSGPGGLPELVPVDLDQISNLCVRIVRHHEPPFCPAWMTPSSEPTRSNVSSARSMCACSSAADI